MSRRYQTARCVLYRERTTQQAEYLLAMHGSMWGRRVKRWGLPGGRIEWREDPVAAALRELREELHVDIECAHEIGDFRYKRRWHKVVSAPWQADIRRFDKLELLELAWFTLPEVLELERGGRLHAGYEREAIEQLIESSSL
ncbi:MAG: NUDIX hydrolase [Pseudomonadota bacterium]